MQIRTKPSNGLKCCFGNVVQITLQQVCSEKKDRSPCIWTRLDDRTPDFCSTFFLCSESFLNGVHLSVGLRALIWAKFMPAAILISKVIVKRLAIAAKKAPWTMWRVLVFSSYMCKSLQMVWVQTKTVAASTHQQVPCCFAGVLNRLDKCLIARSLFHNTCY